MGRLSVTRSGSGWRRMDGREGRWDRKAREAEPQSSRQEDRSQAGQSRPTSQPVSQSGTLQLHTGQSTRGSRAQTHQKPEIGGFWGRWCAVNENRNLEGAQ